MTTTFNKFKDFVAGVQVAVLVFLGTMISDKANDETWSWVTVVLYILFGIIFMMAIGNLRDNNNDH